MTAHAAILGVGNLLLRDEGIGVHAVKKIEKTGMAPDGVMVFDGGTEGFGLLDLISGLERLIVLDCVKGGGEPGTVYCFDARDLPFSPDKYQTSIHQVGICEILHLSDLVGTRPWTTIIGVEPESLSIGTELTDVVAAKVDTIVALALEKVKLIKCLSR